MKAMYLLSAAALLSATALAQPQLEGAVSRHISLPSQPAKVERALLQQATRPIELRSSESRKPGRFEAMDEAAMGIRRAPATTYGAYYSMGDGTLKSSLVWDGGFYGYNYAVAHAFPYTAKFNALLGNSWSMITSTQTVDLNDQADSEGNLVLNDLGIGNFYMPTITNGKTSYTWSTRDTQGQILDGAYFTESWGMGVFDAFENKAFYGGFTGGNYGYGSYTPYGPSNLTRVVIGQLSGPLVVDDVCLWLTTNSQLFATDDDYILVTISDTQADETVKTYEAYIRAENIETASNGSTCGIGKFVEIDEDGFESEVSPVLTGNVFIDITGSEGTDYGIIMVASDMEDEDAEGYEYYDSRSYWWSDGSADGMQERFYRWTADDACVILDARYNALTTYGTPERSATGYVPNDATYSEASDGTKYAWAVAGVNEEGEAYNDFDVESTFDLEHFTVEYDPEVVAGLDFDTTYYADHSLIALFVAVKELPADMETRTTTVTFTSNEEVEYPITITQYGAGAGIKGINKDAEKEDTEIYNLQGVKVSKSEADLPAGVYVKNGKKFVK